MQLFINNWSAVLTAPATASAVSLSVPLADAAKLTGLGGGDHYLLTLAELDGSGVETAWEIVKVTGSASGVLTVLRGQEGTGARDWAAAAVISARVTKGGLEALRAGTGTAVGDDVPQALGVASPGSSAAASRQDHVHAKPTAADIGAATTAQGAKADTAVQPAALASGLGGKVDKDGTKVLSDQNYTTAEKAKLAGLEGAHFKGLHASLAALQSAHPSAVAGDYADVDSGAGADVARYIWDVSDSKWVIQSGATGSMTAAQIKTAYESNPDTNGFSDAEQAKLEAIAAGATANATDAELRDRSTHTGTQAASTISDLAAAVRGVVMTGVSFVTATAGLATDSLLVFLGKLQAQVTSLVTTVAGKQDTLVSGTTLKTVNGTSLLGAGDLALEKYRGLYVSLAALNAAVPTASAGDYADVDSGSGSNVKRYIWDTSDTTWVEQTGSGAGMANPMTTAGDLIVGGSAGVPNRLPVGTTGKVLGVAAGSPAWVDPPASGGGLTSLTEEKASSSPNATVPVVSLSVSIAEANGDVVLAAKGSGATIASVPNGAASGGAKRGNYATDFQKSRGSASQVASGAYSVLGGGRSNTASGQEAVVCGGQSNTASAAQTFIGSGITNTALSNGSSILGGSNNTTGGLLASVLGGQYNLANGSHSVASGRYASTRGIYGARAHASGSSAGEAQTADYVLHRLTQNATPVELTCDGTNPDTGTRIALPNNSAFAFNGRVVARATSSGDAKAWEFSGLIRRAASAGTTALVSAVTPAVIAGDAGASAWALEVAADVTNGSLKITATGVAATNIRWTCHVDSVEVTG